MFATLEAAKRYMNIPADNDTDDELITAMLERASALIETACNRKFAVADYVDYLNGNGKCVILPVNYPLVSVQSLAVSGESIAQESYFFNYDFIMFKRDLRFEKGVKNVEIRYTAGFETIPLDIEQAVIETVALRYAERDRIGQQSKSLAGETVTFFIKDLSPTAQTVVNQYKRVVTPS